jgi:hypothetical protein
MTTVYDCPHAEVCKTCPCSYEDDACFPGERLRAETDRLRKSLLRIAEEPLTGPEKAAVAWAALKKAGKA